MLKQVLQWRNSKIYFVHIIYYIFYALINKPTREVKSSRTIIDNMYCNVPHALNISNVGIIRTYISDHHAIFCLFNEAKLQHYKQNTFMKRCFCERTIAQFSHNLKEETWDIVYEDSIQTAYTWFQGIIDLFLEILSKMS